MKNVKKQGFTLIELLVVVLIIGILAAVAVPQYQKAVEKSRSSQALSMLKSIYQAQASYYVANGEYADSFSKLDIDIPWTGNQKWNNQSKDSRSNGEWSAELEGGNTNTPSVAVGRISGPYAGVGFFIQLPHTGQNNAVPKNELFCVEKEVNGLSFQKEFGDYCVKIMQGKLKPTPGNGWHYYSLP